jgi:hypothetical protein
MSLLDLVGALAGFLLTLMIASYIFGDNGLFRLAIHIFIGVSAGFVTVIVLNNVLWNQLFIPLIQAPIENALVIFPPLLLGTWLLVKASPRLAKIGNPVLAFLVGVGAATAIGGAVFGTVFPQVEAAANAFDLRAVGQSGGNQVKGFFDALVMLVGAVTTLVYFQFGVGSSSKLQTASTAKSLRPAWVEVVSKIGLFFIAVTMGVLFAGVMLAALSALIERVTAVWNFVFDVIGFFFSS